MAFDFPFYFLRHGQTDWNQSGRTQGQLDSQLDETGRAQARRAADLLESRNIARIVSSPLSRARHTAETVATRHDVEITYSDDLMECHLGDRQGKPHGPWLGQYWTGDYDPPGGETFADFAERAWRAMAQAVGAGPDTLIVCHGGLWRAAHEFATIRPPVLPMPNALPLYVIPKDGAWSVRVLGE